MSASALGTFVPSTVHLLHGIALPILFYRNQPVITLAMMDKAHQRPAGTAHRNFKTHRGKLVLGDDYYILKQPDEIRLVGLARADGSTVASIILLAETGYLMLVKSFTDDLAWQVQRQLVKAYFRIQQHSPANRITHAQYRELADIVHTLSQYFVYQYSASHAAWQLARSICGTRATEMSVDHYPAVLAAFQQLDKRARQFLSLREDFEARAIKWVFGHHAEILPEPVFPELQKVHKGRSAS